MKTNHGLLLGFTVHATVVAVVTAIFSLTGCPTDSGSDTTKAATPRANPAAGAVASGTQITLTCDTGGANIYYTLDGSAPSAGSTAYSESAKPAITTALTLKAIAVKSGMADSDVLTVAYTISSNSGPTKAATPTANPAAGAVASGTQITLTCDTGGAGIYYTLDGSTPSAGSTAYSESAKPAITTALTLKAIAVKDGMADSDVLTAAYTISAVTTNYTVSFTVGTGTGTPPASRQAAAGSSITLPGSTGMTPPSGQTFDGWQTQGGVRYAAGDSYTVTGDITFIAQWRQSGPAFTPLTDGVWTSGSIDSTSDFKRYSFYADGGTYHISWKDANGGGGGDGTYTCNVNVFGLREDGTQLFSGDDGIRYPQTISGYTGQVSILVEGTTASQNRTGTFAIKYQSGAPGAIKIVNGNSARSITIWRILESDRATVLINSSGPISGNSDETVEVSPGTYYVWVRIGTVDSFYSTAVTVTSGGTKTVRYTGSSLQVQ